MLTANQRIANLRIMTIETFLRELKRDADAAGGQHKLALDIGCSQAYLSEVLRGTRQPGRKILDHYGYVIEKQVVRKLRA